MRGSKRCEPGCQCAKHTRSGNRGHGSQKTPLIDWSDPEARRAYNRQKAKEKYAANSEPAKEARRKHVERMKEADPDYWRKYRRNAAVDLKYTHNLTRDRFNEILAAQDGNCYLCGEPLDPEAPRGVHVDHDHTCCRGNRSCGKCIRGLACHGCNTGIGAFGDDPERMRRAADRLEAANRRIRER